MAVSDHVDLEQFMAGVRKRNPGQTEFIQAGSRGRAGHLRVHRRQGGVPRGADPAPHRRARSRRQLPRLLGGRRAQHPGAARLAGAKQQRHRPLQGRHPLPRRRDRERAEVPRLRADVQELAHRPAAGRRQGRGELQPEGQIRRGGHALLPVLHDRALPPHRPGNRRAGRRHRRRLARDRLHVRPVQAHHQPLGGRADGQGDRIWRLGHAARGDGLRRRLFPAPHAGPRGRGAGGQDGDHLGRGQRRHPRGRKARRAGRLRAHAVGQRRLRPRSGRLRPGEDRLGQAA